MRKNAGPGDLGRTYVPRHGLPGERRGHKTVVQPTTPDPIVQAKTFLTKYSITIRIRAFTAIAMHKYLEPEAAIALGSPVSGTQMRAPIWTEVALFPE